jgi:hypothetical protein
VPIFVILLALLLGLLTGWCSIRSLFGQDSAAELDMKRERAARAEEMRAALGPNPEEVMAAARAASEAIRARNAAKVWWEALMSPVLMTVIASTTGRSSLDYISSC